MKERGNIPVYHFLNQKSDICREQEKKKHSEWNRGFLGTGISRTKISKSVLTQISILMETLYDTIALLEILAVDLLES